MFLTLQICAPAYRQRLQSCSLTGRIYALLMRRDGADWAFVLHFDALPATHSTTVLGSSRLSLPRTQQSLFKEPQMPESR
jgi:hypothetical protein